MKNQVGLDNNNTYYCVGQHCPYTIDLHLYGQKIIILMPSLLIESGPNMSFTYFTVLWLLLSPDCTGDVVKSVIVQKIGGGALQQSLLVESTISGPKMSFT